MKNPAQPEPHLQLRRLLALKRHEQPPPGYYHKFSANIVARIRAGDRADDKNVLAGVLGDSAWLQRVWNFLEGKPLVAGLFGATACAVVLSLFVMSEKPDTSASGNPPSQQSVTVANILPSSTSNPVQAFGEQPITVSSTDPILLTQPAGVLLDDLGRPKVRPANWTISGDGN